jgi:hypothetical protein
MRFGATTGMRDCAFISRADILSIAPYGT